MVKKIMIIFLSLFLFSSIQALVKVDNPLVSHSRWLSFKNLNHKKYKNEEVEQKAYKIYGENMKKIQKHNKLFNEGKVTFKMAANQFSDLTYEQFVRTWTGARVENVTISSNQRHRMSLRNTLPASVDYRKSRILSPVKNQGICGSCWAFATLLAMEYYVAKLARKIQDFSEQQLVNCAYDYDGCIGGWMHSALDYIIETSKGIQTETASKYTGWYAGNCTAKPPYVATCTGYKYVTTEAELKDAVANVGPVAVAIWASDKFSQYKSGIFDDPSCPPNGTVNHGVVVIGYGTEKGRDYWLIQNSWSRSWGERGYGKMARNKGNLCSIATYGIYPTGCRPLSKFGSVSFFSNAKQ